MSKFKILFRSFVFILIVLSFNQCKKEVEENWPNSTAYVLPENRSGTLYFTSRLHAEEFYKRVNYELNTSHDIDFVLNELERKLNFNSLRNQSIRFRDGEDEQGYTEEEILAELENDFINDDLIKALLNSYYELGIGNDIYVFYSYNQLYKILDADQEAVNAFRNLEKGGSVVPIIALNDKVVIEPNEMYFILKKEINVDDTIQWRNCPVDFIPVVSANSCNPFFRSINGARFCRPPGGGSSFPCNALEYIIDWGDGTPLVTLNNVHDFVVNHLYTSPGQFVIQVTIIVEDGDCDNDIEPDLWRFPSVVNVGNPICDNNERDESGFVISPNGEYALGSKIWWNKTLFGSYAGAFSHLWSWNSNRAKWVRSSGYGTLSVTINATFRENLCMVKGQKQKTDPCSCQRTRATVTMGNGTSYRDREIFSTHTYRHDVLTPPSPFDMDSSLEIVTCQ